MVYMNIASIKNPIARHIPFFFNSSAPKENLKKKRLVKRAKGATAKRVE